MKRALMLCLFSATVGVAVARWLPISAQSAGDSAKFAAARSPETLPATADDVIELKTGSPTRHDEGHVIMANHVDMDVDLAELTEEERINVRVYDRVNRSVVNINTRAVRSDPFSWFEVPSEGAGSGSVLDKSGHILTNFHVVEGAREIQVTLFDGNSYEARPVGVDPNTDLAVIKIDAPAETLVPVQLGDSTRLRVGQRVFAIGNPFGLERTLTVGILSSLNRSIRSRNQRKINSILQTDAAINPGNSGGPLLDSHGRLIGVNTAIASRTGQSSGVGFAIPVSAVRRIAPQLIQNGRVNRAEIGISKVVETEHGLVIATTTDGGPAEKAGLQGFKLVTKRRRQGPFVYEQQYIDRSAADRIVAVDGQPVTGADEFLHLIESHRPGDSVAVTVVRQGRRVDVAVVLEAG